MSSAQRAGGDPSAEREARAGAEGAGRHARSTPSRPPTPRSRPRSTRSQANVAGQQALLAEANRAAAEAEAAFVEATPPLRPRRPRSRCLREESASFAVEAFVHPPADDALAALDSDDPGEAAEKRALLEIQNTNDADLLDRLTAAEEDLEVKRQLAEDASARAEEKQAAAAGRLAELTAARDQQAAYASQVQARLDRKLGEIAVLEDLDADLAAKIRADQAAAAALARKAAAAAPPGPSGGGGGVAAVAEVAAVRSPVPRFRLLPRRRLDHHGRLDRRLAAVAAQRRRSSGVNLCGGGYRSSAEQIATRRANCGTSYYAIYQMPSSQCSPPTAPPGTSMHERGHAVDFNCNGGGVIGSRSSPCWNWLAGNASSYGFYNLPSEPWHWSTSGN